jgi:predicted PurR-regulated permease PerM
VDRFDRATGAVWKVFGLASFFIAWLGFAPRYVAFSTAVVTLVGAMVAVVVALLLSFERDVSDNFEAVQSTIEDGIQDVLDAVNAQATDTTDEEPRMTDGGHERTGEIPASGRRGVTGHGALGGLMAGAFLGAPFGPVGVLLGVAIGGVLGNEIEYWSLKKDQGGA